VRRNCTLSKAEDKRVREEALKHGSRPTPFLKKTAFAYLNKKYLVPEKTSDRLRELICLLRNMANNLNQIARRANAVQKVSFTTIFKAERIVQKLEEAVRAFIHNPPTDDR